MKCVIFFVSPNGTTRKSAELLAEELRAYQHSVQTVNIGRSPYREDLNMAVELCCKADVLGFGSPVYHMDVLEPMETFFDVLLERRNSLSAERKLRAFVFLTYCGITSGKALLHTHRKLQALGIPVIGAVKIAAPHFHHHETFPKPETKRIIQEFVRSLDQRGFAEIEPVRCKKLFRPAKFLTRLLFPIAQIIGKRRELPITLDAKECRFCGKCVRECPVGAISLEKEKKKALIDSDVCIHCYHCTVVCPFSAITSPVEKLDGMIAENRKIIGEEKPVNAFFV
ncbi:MAG: 4Fe-4S binding protein [Spirochaetales bacterium]|nr:4Fe-4S binding protein [Spirochaetales bacterium]